MKNILKLALIMSGVGIVASLIMNFAFEPDFLFSIKSALFSLVLTGLVVVYFGRKLLRDPEEGRLGYGQAVKKLFIAFLITALISSIFGIFMYGNNEELKSSWSEYQVEMQESGARLGSKLAGRSEAEQEAAAEEVRQMIESGEIQKQSYPFTWSQLPMMIVNSTVMYLLLTLLLALFVREKETQFS